MKIYVLIPLGKIREVKIKERDYGAARVMLTPDYSECFGKENEYYIDWASQVKEARGRKTISYKHGCSTWWYTALNPQDVIKKRIKRGEEAKTCKFIC